MFQRYLMLAAFILTFAVPAMAQEKAAPATTTPAPVTAAAPAAPLAAPVAETKTAAPAKAAVPVKAVVSTDEEGGEEAMPAATTAVNADPLPDSGPISTLAKQAYMVDYDTGTVLFEKDPDARMPTSSMSKTITAYVIFEALKNGQITLDTLYPVSERAWRMQGSKMFVELGKEIKVGDLLQGVIVQSGNDATVVLAEGLAGNEASFADALNKKAAELGMKNSHFVNASGWPDPDHYSTARDLVTLGRAIIHDFPEDYKYFDEKEFTYNNIKQGNRNPLLYRGIGADGIKTGHTEGAGYGLIASAKIGERRVVLVVNGLSDMQERADESAKLIEWGLRAFENRTLFKAGATVETVPVILGAKASVPLVVFDDVTITIPRVALNDVKAVVKYSTPLKAPVKKGDQIGTLEVTLPGAGGTKSYPLVTGEDVPQLGFFPKLAAKLKYKLGGAHVTAEAAAPTKPATL